MLGLVAIYLHHLFEGECLPLDLWREWQLARVPLDELDRRWAADPARSDIVISLTTIPSRIDVIDDTLKSLLDQRRRPARIVLNVPRESLRERRAYDVPERLKRLASVEIRPCDDLGPATKSIPALLAGQADQPVLVVDDDRIYPPGLVAEFERWAGMRPDAALTAAGWVVPEDLTDRPTTLKSNLLMLPPAPLRGTRLKTPQPVDIVMGVMGYLVRPRFFDPAELTDFSGPEALRFVDDVRTSALCRAERLVIPVARLGFLPKRRWSHYKDTALANINRGSGDAETRGNTVAIRHYAERWRVGGKRPISRGS